MYEKLLHSGILSLRPDYAAEPKVAGGGVDGFREPGRGSIPAAIIRRAQLRPALDDLARNADGGIAWIVAGLGFRTERVSRDAARLDDLAGMPRLIEVGRPLP